MKNFSIILSAVDVLCFGTSRTAFLARWQPSNGKTALCQCTVKTTLICCSTCAVLSVESFQRSAPCTKSSPTGMGYGTFRTRWAAGKTLRLTGREGEILMNGNSHYFQHPVKSPWCIQCSHFTKCLNIHECLVKKVPQNKEKVASMMTMELPIDCNETTTAAIFAEKQS